MLFLVHQKTGLPFVEGIHDVVNLPHTISYVINFKTRIDNLAELPKDKQPPRGIIDKPHKLEEFLDTVWDKKGAGQEQKFVEYNLEEAE